jgi:N-acetylmuramoyl-L-alanine amidase
VSRSTVPPGGPLSRSRGSRRPSRSQPDPTVRPAARRPPVRRIRTRRAAGARSHLFTGALVAVAVVLVMTALSLVFGSSGAASSRRLGSRRPSAHPVTVTAPAEAHETALDPSVFSAGSCVAFAPTRGDRHLTVFLDAGHGGPDPGAVGETESGTPLHESNLTLPVELDAMALLRGDGYRVVVSRTTNGTVARIQPGDLSRGVFTIAGAHREVAERDVCANLAGADVLVGIYFDAGATPENAGSVTDYDAARPFASKNLEFGRILQHDVLASLKDHGWSILDDGVNSDVFEGGPALSSAAASYDHLLLLGPAKAGYFSTPSEMPGAVIEPLFITDPWEADIADSALGQQAIAEGIARAVEQFLSASSMAAS